MEATSAGGSYSDDPKNNTNVHKNDLAEGTPRSHISFLNVPDDVLSEGVQNGKPNKDFNNSLHQNMYSVPRKPCFSPKVVSVKSQVPTRNSFAVLEKDTKTFPQKRARKQAKKAIESKAPGIKGLWEESALNTKI